MRPCLKCIMNCPTENHIFLQTPQIVQIIGIKPFNDQINFIISDGKFFTSSFLIPRIKHFGLFQLIEFKKFFIHRVENGTPILIIHPSKILSNQKDCIGQPTQFNSFSSIPSLRLLKCNFTEDITPIKDLNVYEPFTILARVVNIFPQVKDPYITLRDSNNDEINGEFEVGTFEYFSEKVQVNRIYLISNVLFSEVIDFKKILTISKKSIFKETNDDFSIDLKLNPQQLINLGSSDKASFYADIKAIIVDVGSIQRSKTDGFNRILLLADESEATIQLKLNDSYALSIQESDESHVVIIKNAFFKKKFGCMYAYIEKNSYLKVLDYEHHDAIDLVNWYQSIEGAIGDFKHLSNKRKVKISQIRSENLGKNLSDYFIVEAKLKQILVCGVFYSFNNEEYGINSNYIPKTDRAEKFILYYNTCPFNCSRRFKKLVITADKKLYCPECNKIIEKPNVLYQFDALFSDDSGNDQVFRVKTFNQGIGELILGMKASIWKEETENLSKEEKEKMTEKSLINYRLELSAAPDITGKREYPILTIEKIFPLFEYV